LYPIFAKEARVAGEVLLQLTISETGSVESLQVLRGPIALRQAAIDAVKSWRFKPYIVNSEPTAADTKVSVLFKLSR
jgi:protein TonB